MMQGQVCKATCLVNGLSVACLGSIGEQQQASVQPDPEIVSQLVGMGFSENGSKRAAVATQVCSRHHTLQ